MLSSNYHVEMSPGDVGNNDRYVVQVSSREQGTGGWGSGALGGGRLALARDQGKGPKVNSNRYTVQVGLVEEGFR